MTPTAKVLAAIMVVSTAIGLATRSTLTGIWAGVALCAAWLWFVGSD